MLRLIMGRYSTLFLVTLTASLLLGASLAAQCMPDPTNPCVATCNGSTFDLSQVFDFPYVRMHDGEFLCTHQCELFSRAGLTLLVLMATITCTAHAAALHAPMLGGRLEIPRY